MCTNDKWLERKKGIKRAEEINHVWNALNLIGMPVICYKYLLHRSANYNGAELWRSYRSTLYQEMKEIISYEIKDILLYEGNILNISMLSFTSIENALHLLCTNIHFYVHHNVLKVVLCQVRGNMGEGLRSLLLAVFFSHLNLFSPEQRIITKCFRW